MNKQLILLCTCIGLLTMGCVQVAANQKVSLNAVPHGEFSEIDSLTNNEGWTLVWSDEFDGSAIDRSKWGFEQDCWGGGNNERQCYTDSAANASIEQGSLVITALKEESVGPALPKHLRATAEDQNATSKKPFTSARLTTKGKASWLYGRIDVRAKLPQGQGTWPAIWMLPEDNRYGRWAASGEIDIMEAVNLGVSCAKCTNKLENTILGTLHFGGIWPNNAFSSSEVQLTGSLEDFHTYSIIWREGQIIWFIDGKQFAVKNAKDWSTTSSDNPNAPFNQPFHLILNLAIGGGLPEGRGLGGVSDNGFPKQFIVDFVRVWKCTSEAGSDQNCRGKRIE